MCVVLVLTSGEIFDVFSFDITRNVIVEEFILLIVSSVIIDVLNLGNFQQCNN